MTLSGSGLARRFDALLAHRLEHPSAADNRFENIVSNHSVQAVARKQRDRPGFQAIE